MSVAVAEPRQLSVDDVDFFNEHGYLRLKQVFSPAEVAALSEELDHIIQYFATHGKGWSGPWRKQLMEAEAEAKSLLVTIHELQSYSEAWAHALVQERLVQSVADIIGPDLEFHHSTLHAKGPDTGTPFPMHQDYPFYPHQDGRYIDAIVHVDGADETSGCLKFLEGSHKLGPLEHSREGSPHLDQNVYRLEDATSVPADPGDVVLFSIWTIHGSALNVQPRWRRVVRFGYRN
ncbi:MAG: phytanoyl-CoA dioxygenase family protein, partial [Chloroflexota bacterium]|nr:phytanoyl-CoA dioxygenase family protein [Chloroflexota bacterium]